MLEEAAFKLVKDAHAAGGRPGAYFGAYLHWLQRGLPGGAGLCGALRHSRARALLRAGALTPSCYLFAFYLGQPALS